MLLDDTAPCPGRIVRVSNRPAPVCFGCERYHLKAGKPIKPAAVFDGGQWSCAERRSEGHVAEHEASRESGASLGCGFETNDAERLS